MEYLNIIQLWRKIFHVKYKTILHFLCSCSYLFTFLLSSQFYWHIRLRSTADIFDPICTPTVYEPNILIARPMSCRRWSRAEPCCRRREVDDQCARERRTGRPTRKPELDHGYYRASTASRWYDTIGLGMAFETKGLRKILQVSWMMDSRENKWVGS